MSHPPLDRPFPLAALIAQMPDTTGLQRSTTLRVTVRQWERIKARSALSVDEADRFANAIGYHPAELWGDLWWDHAEQETA